MASTIKTRLLFPADTHSKLFPIDAMPTQRIDVAIHCGDLTHGSMLSEFRTSLQLLKALNAPLKLMIAGNHDFTLDIPAFDRKVSEATPALDPEDIIRVYGKPGDVRQLFDKARNEGIIFLDEGTHHFGLENGAVLTVCASPYTPALGAWGFQYHPDDGHNFAVRKDRILS